MSISHHRTSCFYPGPFEREEEDSLLQQFSVCPSCHGQFGLALILPCSHPMCGRCVEAAAASVERMRRSSITLHPGLNPCTVLCSCCRGPVELPCWTWSSAVSCLPQYPNLSFGRSTEERGASSQENEQEISNRQETTWDGGVDLLDEEMEQTVFGLHFALDSSHVPPSVCLSHSSLTATYQPQKNLPTGGSNSLVQPMAELRADVLVRHGQYYWEVDVCNSALYRIGVCSWDGSRSWWFERRGFHFSAAYDGAVEPVYSVPPGIKTIGLFLNVNGGALSFYNALSREHLVTLPTRFDSGGVVPAFALGQGRLKMRTGLPPPPLVFHSKDSRYRGAQGSEGGLWRKGIDFGSVRKVVEKFEELALSQ